MCVATVSAVLGLAVPAVAAGTATLTPKAAACGSCVADIAIYDPDNEDDGVWEEEVTALQTFARTYGWTTARVDASDLNTGELGVGEARRYRMLVAPGGYAATRMIDVTATGDDGLRAFVNSGGGYVGLCGGAYWAAQTVSFATIATGGLGTFNAPRDYWDYPYDLGLFSGTAIGPFGWTPWANGTLINFERAQINTAIPELATAGLPAKTRFLYGGGSSFRPATVPPGYQVWASAIAARGTSTAASTGNGEPTVIRFDYGQGNVVLFAYHPDILIHSKRDGVTLRQYYPERLIRWKRGNQSFAQINHDSWNIVHAAFQVSMSQPVSPARRAPNAT